MKKTIALILFTINALSLHAMNDSGTKTPPAPLPTSSIENLLDGLSPEEKKEIVQTYKELNSTLQVASILVPIEEIEIQKKKEALKNFCIGKIGNSSHRDSKGSN